MKDILATVEGWRVQGESIAIATVIQTWGSSPRRLGAKMAVTASGLVAGSVSGGCVEGAVIETCFRVIRTNQPQRLHFGVADDSAWEVGLACGGAIDVLVKPLNPVHFGAVRAALDNGCVTVTVSICGGAPELLGREIVVSENGQVLGTFGDELDAVAVAEAQTALRARQSSFSKLAADRTLEVFLDVTAPPLEIIMVGGVHIAVTLAQLAQAMGYRTIVIDPRDTFGSAERFPQVDRLIQAWPQAAFEQVKLSQLSAVAMLTHDPKLDDPALKIALPSPAFYVGALGSRKTQEQRRQRLLAAGLTEEQLDRLHGPIGLDLGGQTPQEIALAILAQIVLTRSQHTESTLS